MDTLLQSCESFDQYPQNLVQSDILSHTLKSYFERLGNEERRLFNERQAAVDFLDSSSSGHEFLSSCATTLTELKEVLREGWRVAKDPQCRFIFLHAPHSRAPLRVGRDMASFLLTYHQVMPSFLDFIFPFGKQIEAQDFYFGGLRDESRLGKRQQGLQIPRLNRSGNDIRLSYNLRSVEKSTSQPGLQWSIRQSAVYHSFDVETGQSLWINVKGNKLIKNRIAEATSTSSSISHISTREEAFSSTLSVHLLLCDWSCENWRWYLNDLEREFHRLAKDAPYIPVEREPSPQPSSRPFPASPRTLNGGFSPISRRGTNQSPGSPWTKMGHFSRGPSRTTTLMDSTPNMAVTDSSQENCYAHNPWTKAGLLDARMIKSRLNSFYSQLKQNLLRNHAGNNDEDQLPTSEYEKNPVSPFASDVIVPPPEMPPNFSQDGDEKPHEIFTFADLQALQGVEDKLQEALLVLRLNVEVLEELRQHYQFVTSHSAFPAALKSQCAMDLAKFTKSVLNAEKDLRMLQSRTETLLRMLENKKNLLNGILHYRGVKANEAFARKNQLSAERMELMTLEMHAIAKKTEKETVSMRVITSVTLFFLPATFIAVCCLLTGTATYNIKLNDLQTFMSTDILSFEDGKQNFQLKALHIYLAIVVPLTAVTFLVWWLFYRMAKKATSQGDLEA